MDDYRMSNLLDESESNATELIGVSSVPEKKSKCARFSVTQGVGVAMKEDLTRR